MQSDIHIDSHVLLPVAAVVLTVGFFILRRLIKTDGKCEIKLRPPSFAISLHSNKSVRLPGKQVSEKKADKQKAVPKEAEFASNGTVFYVVKIISELKNIVNL